MQQTIALLGSVALLVASAAAQTPPIFPASDMSRMNAARAAAEKLPDTAGTGPFPSVKLVDPGLPDHVIYRPSNLRAPGSPKFGILIWGNGGCSDDGAGARLHLAEIASHGYIVIAPGKVFSGPGALARPPRTEPQASLSVSTTSAQVSAGLDWALAENVRAGSPLFGRIDPALVAVAGHSCGGLQALQLAADPRIQAVIIHDSGVFRDGTAPIKGMTIDKSALRTLHTPVIYILGGQEDVAFPNGSDDYARITAVPAMLVSHDTGHGGTFNEPNGGENAQVAAAWLDWQLRHDPRAARWFVGAGCRLCTDPRWTVKKKGFD